MPLLRDRSDPWRITAGMRLRRPATRSSAFLRRRRSDGGIVGFAGWRPASAPSLSRSTTPRPRQSAKPHGNRALFAPGCLRPLDDASFGMVADSASKSARACTPPLPTTRPDATVPSAPGTRARAYHDGRRWGFAVLAAAAAIGCADLARQYGDPASGGSVSDRVAQRAKRSSDPDFGCRSPSGG